jgi:hypothetical protein
VHALPERSGVFSHRRRRPASSYEEVPDLRHRGADGTTRLVFDPIELLERLPPDAAGADPRYDDDIAVP